MDFARVLSRCSSSSYNASSLSEAGNNKGTPSSSCSRADHRDLADDDEQVAALPAFPPPKLEAEGKGEEEQKGQDGKDLQEDSHGGLFPSILAACTHNHQYASSTLHSEQQLPKLERSNSLDGASPMHGSGPYNALQQHCFLPPQDTASSNIKHGSCSHGSSSLGFNIYRNSGAMQSANQNFHGGCTSSPFLWRSTTERANLSIPLGLPPPCPGSAVGGVFSIKQWNEFTQQVYIFKHLAAGVSLPPTLFLPFVTTMFSLSQAGTGLCPMGNAGGSFGFSRGGIDPEPGRCRRTDGKKWRCSRDAVPDQKYCERHINRGRNRSKSKNPGRQSTVMPTAMDLSKSTTSMDSQLQFSLGTPCKSPLEDMKHGGAGNTLAESPVPSLKHMPLALPQTQMTHDLATIITKDMKLPNLEPVVQSISHPFQRFSAKLEGSNHHLDAHSWQPVKSPFSLYEDPQRLRTLSSTNLSIQTRPVVKFDSEEELLEDSRPTWPPISWEVVPSVMGGPLMEVVQFNGKDGHHHGLVSPTGVLHRIPFGSYSDSSSSASSPHSSALRPESSLVGFCDAV